MSDNPISHPLNDEEMRRLAISIFDQHGIDCAKIRRAGGWTNAVWFVDDLVLRLSIRSENRNLIREAQIASFLPSDVGYPAIIDTGVTENITWMLSTKLPGQSLGEAWTGIKTEERVIALKGLWDRARAVHSVPVDKVSSIVSGQAWFNSTDPEVAEKSLARLTVAGIFTSCDKHVLQGHLTDFWMALPRAPRVLCHGDLSMDNALWHAGRVTSLLDFEFAVLAPVELDLNHLVKCVFGPEDLIKNGDEILRLRPVVKELAYPILARPASQALLLGYAILLELWLLDDWLAHPEGEGPLEQWDPLRRLRSIATGRSGYLEPLFQEVVR